MIDSRKGDAPQVWRCGFWAVVEQGLFASSNFLLNVLLGRWLPAAEYGAFAVGLSVLLFSMALHSALVIEPFLVFGPGRYRRDSSGYLRAVLLAHWGLSGILSLALLAGGLGLNRLGARGLGALLLVLAATSPMILFLWVMRRATYAGMVPQESAAVGFLYFACVLAGALFLQRRAALSPAAVFLWMGGSGLAAGTLLWARRKGKGAPAWSPVAPVRVFAEHWGYGKWALGTGLVAWVPANIGFFLLGGWFSLEETGALRALMNLLLPAVHLTSALGTLLVPALVLARESGGSRGFARLLARASAVILLPAGAYGVLLLLLRKDLLQWLYSGYAPYHRLVVLTAVIPLLSGGVVVLSSCLRARERPDQVFKAFLVSALVSVSLGAVLIGTLGVAGALWNQMISLGVAGALMARFARRRIREEESRRAGVLPELAGIGPGGSS